MINEKNLNKKLRTFRSWKPFFHELKSFDLDSRSELLKKFIKNIDTVKKMGSEFTIMFLIAYDDGEFKSFTVNSIELLSLSADVALTKILNTFENKYNPGSSHIDVGMFYINSVKHSVKKFIYNMDLSYSDMKKLSNTITISKYEAFTGDTRLLIILCNYYQRTYYKGGEKQIIRVQYTNSPGLGFYLCPIFIREFINNKRGVQ